MKMWLGWQRPQHLLVAHLKAARRCVGDERVPRVDRLAVRVNVATKPHLARGAVGLGPACRSWRYLGGCQTSRGVCCSIHV